MNFLPCCKLILAFDQPQHGGVWITPGNIPQEFGCAWLQKHWRGFFGEIPDGLSGILLLIHPTWLLEIPRKAGSKQDPNDFPGMPLFPGSF